MGCGEVVRPGSATPLMSTIDGTDASCTAIANNECLVSQSPSPTPSSDSNFSLAKPCLISTPQFQSSGLAEGSVSLSKLPAGGQDQNASYDASYTGTLGVRSDPRIYTEWEDAANEMRLNMGRDFPAAVGALERVVDLSYIANGLPEINEAIVSARLLFDKAARIVDDCSNPDIFCAPSVWADFSDTSENLRGLVEKRRSALNQFAEDVYGAVRFGAGGRVEIGFGLHAIVAGRLLNEFRDSEAAARHYELASRAAPTMAERRRFHLLSLQTLSDDDLRRHRGKIEKIYRTELPSLAQVAENLRLAGEITEREQQAATDFIRRVEQSKTAEEIEMLQASFADKHPVALGLIRESTEPPLFPSGDSDAIKIAPRERPFALSSLLSTLFFSTAHASETTAYLNSLDAAPTVAVRDYMPSAEELMGVRFSDATLRDAGYPARGEIVRETPLPPGEINDILDARIIAWNLLYRIDSKRGVKPRRKAEEELMRIIAERLDETGGKIPLVEKFLYAGSMGAILIEATKRGGDIERELGEDRGSPSSRRNVQAAQARHDTYSGYLNKIGDLFAEDFKGPQRQVVREVMAGLNMRMQYDGRMALHRYREVFDEALPALVQSWGDTKTVAERIDVLARLYPHRFRDGKVVPGGDFSRTEVGLAAAEREGTFFENIADAGEGWLALGGIGILGGAVGCGIGALVMGACGTAVEPGGGTAAGGIVGCKKGSLAGAALAGVLYEKNRQSAYLSANREYVEAAAKAGVSSVLPKEAERYRWLSRGDLALGGVFALPLAGLGAGFTRFGFAAMAGGAGVTIWTATAAGIGNAAGGGAAFGNAADAAASTLNGSTGPLLKDFWRRLWRQNVRKSFWRVNEDLTELEKRVINWTADHVGGVPSGTLKVLLQLKEPIMWVPGTIYGVRDYAENQGKLSFKGGVALAMPVNQLGRIGAGLNTNGAVVFLGFTLGLEALQQIQGGADYKAPDGVRVLYELAWSAPQRALYNIVVKGKPRFANTLLEPVLEPIRMWGNHKGRVGSLIFRSIENPRNEGFLWTWATRGDGSRYKAHTAEGSAVQLLYLIPLLAPTVVGQASSQDADFSNLFLQVVARYGYGAFFIIPRIKAPRGMDSASAEFGGRTADGIIRVGMNETINKYIPSAIGFRIAVANHDEHSDPIGGAFMERARKGMTSLEPLSAIGRIIDGKAVDHRDTWYRPHIKAWEGYRRHMSEVLMGGPGGSAYDQYYCKTYRVYSAHLDRKKSRGPTIYEFAANWIKLLDNILKNQSQSYLEEDAYSREYVAVSAFLLRDFASLSQGVTTPQRSALIKLARDVYERNKPKIDQIAARARLEDPEISAFAPAISFP